jgi:hypothetical protein
MNGSVCPKCRNDIGVVSIFKALTPYKIKCPNCESEIFYSNFPVYKMFLYGVFLIMSILLSTHFLRPTEYVFLLYLSQILIFIGLFEFFLAKYLRSNYELTLK